MNTNKTYKFIKQREYQEMVIQGANTFTSIKKVIQAVRKHSVLATLPLYFVLDATNQFWGLIPFSSGIVAFASISGSMLLLFLGLKIFLQKEKALIFLVWVTICYLFFKTIKDWLVVTVGLKMLSSYSFYLSFLFLLALLVLFIVFKLSVQNARKLSAYLNLLVFILIVIEVGKSVYHSGKTKVQPYVTADIQLTDLSSKKYPDIYILQFDEYAGLYTLNSGYGIDNSKFVEDLKKRSFHVAQNSNSNYNGTPFSVLSLLNMSYIDGVSKTEVSSAIGYSKSADAIKENKLTHFFRNNQYKIVNHSFFEVEQTEPLNYLFLPIKKRLMLDKTFGSVLINDLLCSVNSNSFHFFINDFPARIDNYNQEVIKRSFETIESEIGPVFMYSHFMMPHSPFLRDSSGRLRSMGMAYVESNKTRNIESYIQYLKYCNIVSLKMIDSIQAKKPNSIIVLLSDHGLRNSKLENRKYIEFNNFLAIYSPSKEDFQMPDSVCTVNTFRLIMNAHYDQAFPMLDNRMINVNMGLIE
ncbi:sulfatase-like hydrolase/transferase [Lacibacter sp. H375]|uniref:sulfatase-like hydrolase/transferase n=1 Tax=Lacibacter sp. H375 TaxID=3133424 RepID=UPI0030BC9334